ncbi:hypothetical protein J2Y45_006159 [Dyadobacter sp. BE34]|uniref:Uncharacterized protein n=1 Tax=Dyadobacter fermentans TaxID=94254 RepID=A0ABU1R8L6_9BACT|nr:MULTISPECIES: hypothetical protein [Dyadobacter]MDR6808945.1 hypothetical protein [Dyadobacter fermentans]MDR7046688.1 hypothetical protein [Dyadobacter sp. BE242]MDR7201002.1 hypothetical protein [Dyadobacter sp. BE34]MDR7218962.1 hypothetical protein [Dyadobacter sp. BE31]MDR7264828.1 hypothetical protein [Dyadobacter sp. BE32]
MLKFLFLSLTYWAIYSNVFLEGNTGRPAISDTLFFSHAELSTVDRRCFQFLAGYRLNSGVFISNYYSVIDSLSLDLNDDKLTDKVLVLEPRSLNPDATTCDLSFDRNPKRLLVVVINAPLAGAKIREVYKSVLSDAGGVLSHYDGIHVTRNGFKVVHTAGAAYAWEYSMEFSTGKNRITLREISKRCSYGDKSDSLLFRYHRLGLDKVNVPDTLSNQCNCDAIWSKLNSK